MKFDAANESVLPWKNSYMTLSYMSFSFYRGFA